jgi:DNA-binding winged helix-turn-helix (wHTH) protein/tetratricopeptide (TPR) repeat protein
LRDEGRFIKLAQVPPFRLGAVLVDPPRRRVSHGERAVTVEPRVMQVLVVLAEAQGAVISRDELIERCWGGRIVGENAINRVISRIRQLAAELGVESFQLETITKVGYRMVLADEAAADTPSPWPEAGGLPARILQDEPSPATHSWTRRGLIAGGAAAVALAAAGGWLWSSRRGYQPHPEAVEWHRRAQIAQRQGQAEQVRQAVSFFTRATEIDPLYAEAWGGLALSYRHILEGFAEGEMNSLPGLIESAGRRALALDPDNADAGVALALILPYFRNWARIENELIALGRRHPDHWFVQAQLGIVRYETGRWRDGFAHTERQLELEPYIPIPHVHRARALWSLGRLQEAEAELDASVARWPANFMLWNLKFSFLLFTGRFGSAVAFAADPQTQPDNLRPEAIEVRRVLARAIERREPADVAASLDDLRRQSAAIASVPLTAPLFLALGRPDLAFLALERYFFGGPAGELGPVQPPPSTYERRYTAFLFMPNMAPLWREPRFAALLERAGLERYWRESRTAPDYRRG